MTYLLNIHTATETAIINLAADADILDSASNHEPRQHAAFLHTAIQKLLQQRGLEIKQLGAISATSGPGSYTGIRVGLATAKGLCYALKIPLITYNTLEAMAVSSISIIDDADASYCPMIDARRMEVYTALYNYKMNEILPPSALIVGEYSFGDRLNDGKIYFSGSGHHKFQQVTTHKNAFFVEEEISSESLAKIAWKKYGRNEFENIPYAQPLYIK